MAINKFKEKLFQAIAKEYGEDGFPMSYEKAREHDSGDGLADFIRIELDEAIYWEDSEKEIIDQAERFLLTAQDDLKRAISAVQKLRDRR